MYTNVARVPKYRVLLVQLCPISLLNRLNAEKYISYFLAKYINFIGLRIIEKFVILLLEIHIAFVNCLQEPIFQCVNTARPCLAKFAQNVERDRLRVVEPTPLSVWLPFCPYFIQTALALLFSADRRCNFAL